MRRNHESKSKIELQDATVDDAFIIDPMLRKEDVAEIRASSVGGNTQMTIAESIAMSDWCKLAYVDNELIAVFGMVKFDHGGNPWMLGTRHLENHPAAVGRVSKVMVERMLKEDKYLFNWVHVKHHKAIKWLRWLGFIVEKEPSVLGPTGEGFCHFYIGDRDV